MGFRSWCVAAMCVMPGTAFASCFTAQQADCFRALYPAELAAVVAGEGPHAGALALLQAALRFQTPALGQQTLRALEALPSDPNWPEIPEEIAAGYAGLGLWDAWPAYQTLEGRAAIPPWLLQTGLAKAGDDTALVRAIDETGVTVPSAIVHMAESAAQRGDFAAASGWAARLEIDTDLSAAWQRIGWYALQSGNERAARLAERQLAGLVTGRMGVRAPDPTAEDIAAAEQEFRDTGDPDHLAAIYESFGTPRLAQDPSQRLLLTLVQGALLRPWDLDLAEVLLRRAIAQGQAMRAEGELYIAGELVSLWLAYDRRGDRAGAEAIRTLISDTAFLQYSFFLGQLAEPRRARLSEEWRGPALAEARRLAKDKSLSRNAKLTALEDLATAILPICQALRAGPDGDAARTLYDTVVADLKPEASPESWYWTELAIDCLDPQQDWNVIGPALAQSGDTYKALTLQSLRGDAEAVIALAEAERYLTVRDVFQTVEVAGPAFLAEVTPGLFAAGRAFAESLIEKYPRQHDTAQSWMTIHAARWGFWDEAALRYASILGAETRAETLIALVNVSDGGPFPARWTTDTMGDYIMSPLYFAPDP